MKNVDAEVKKAKGTEEEPFEGEVNEVELMEYVNKMIVNDKAAGKIVKYIIEVDASYLDKMGYLLTSDYFGNPELCMNIQSSSIMDRYKKKNEIDEINEELQDELRQKEEKE